MTPPDNNIGQPLELFATGRHRTSDELFLFRINLLKELRSLAHYPDRGRSKTN